ncbi:DNA gyrase subunit A [Alphaproteobacteria bacterium SO-S41]|nr:DNA gyrase subunit A [Alphaproteobacteria bacterium SO-S41]
MSSDDTDIPPPDEPEALPPGGGEVRPINIEDELKRSYLDYAMSVIVSRALPDVRDGLKPGQRRILFGMDEAGNTPDKRYRKSANTVGEVMGRYHPHGDSAIYDALVRMAQDFSMAVPLIDGQGNFGSMDGDPAAAMRYTESRLTKAAMELLEGIDEDTVDFQPNYDGERREPVVLPARFPNLLVNGAGGIAVGMATNIPPHNLGEVVDAAVLLIDDPDATMEAVLDIVQGPDFPTGGLIMGKAATRAAMAKGRGSVIMRSRCVIEEIRKDREAIVVSEVPFQVNKSAMIEKISELVKDKRIEGISDLRDESDRDGVRVVIELKRDAIADVVLNQLYKFSPLQTSFGVNMLAIDAGKPELMNVRDMLVAFLRFREQVVTRRTKFRLNKARDRSHILVGLAIALANIDEFIRIIRTSPDPAAAREALTARRWPAKDMVPLVMLIADPRHVMADDRTLLLSDEQARAILDLRLQRLTALGADEIGKELEDLRVEIEDHLETLRSRAKLMGIVRTELEAVKAQFATPRRTEIIELDADVEDEDLIQREDMAVTVTHEGYIKRVPLATYRVQARGGKGRTGITTKDEDWVTRVFVANTHTPILFFTSNGMAYKLKCWRLPLSTPQGKGKALVNLLPLKKDEKVTTIMELPEESQWESLQVMFATQSGYVRRNQLSDFVDVRANGKIAMKLDDDDHIAGVAICTENDDVLLSTKGGKAMRFPVTEVRVFKGRDSTGVRGVKLAADDELISLGIMRHVEATAAEARAYLKQVALARRPEGEEAPVEDAVADDGEEEASEEATLSPERFAELAKCEEFLLTVTDRGFGKRTSAFAYPAKGRGGQGVKAVSRPDRVGTVLSVLTVEDSDELMMVTDKGQTIRLPVAQISFQGRASNGVILFRTDGAERVVSVERVAEASTEG